MLKFTQALSTLQREAENLRREADEANKKTIELPKLLTANAKLAEENAALKRQLDELKNSIAFTPEKVDQISEEQRDKIGGTLMDWSSQLYSYDDLTISNSNCIDRSYYVREYALADKRREERDDFVQRLMQILGG